MHVRQFYREMSINTVFSVYINGFGQPCIYVNVALLLCDITECYVLCNSTKCCNVIAQSVICY